ncbi:hypothetical protein OTU49_006935 [Cherax quadricarinatus]|uniref:Carcinin n=1 Tax=Cherax quadricarinatus TaxID=27406 RepID=A0A977J6M6_CHEQU|nr:uncharacterized protein LOC128700838 [Cherax quadricarinatus]UWX37251.1 carcinin [Cherax quadricarinatus]
MLRFVVLTLLVAMVIGQAKNSGCNYFCTKPEGPNKGAHYCCSPPFIPLKPEEKHPGKCPPPLKDCTRIIPQVCPHDGHCPFNQKCCFDTCLDLHTCKPAHF